MFSIISCCDLTNLKVEIQLYIYFFSRQCDFNLMSYVDHRHKWIRRVFACPRCCPLWRAGPAASRNNRNEGVIHFGNGPSFSLTFAGNETSPESFLLHNALARKPKRIRTAFSPSQLLRLEHAFEKNHYVVGAERKQLAHSLSLTETQVRALSFSMTLYLEGAAILFRNFMPRFPALCARLFGALD